MSGFASERVLSWLLLLLALAGSIWLIQRETAERGRRDTRTAEHVADPVGLVPAGAELIMTVDVEGLAVTVGRDLLAAGGAGLLGLQQDCGFEPLLALRRLAFAIPTRPAESASDFALIAQTTLEVEPVLRCAETLIRKRGGRAVRSELGQFRAVRDQAKPGGEVAIRADGVLVLSGGDYFRDVLDTINGTAAPDETARLRTAVHGGLRRQLGAADLVVTLLPGRMMPLAEVQALGLALRVKQRLELAGFVGCSNVESCGAARALIEAIKADFAKEPELAGLASLGITQREAGLELSGQLPRQALVPMLQQLLAP
jgi:hypothetical protein